MVSTDRYSIWGFDNPLIKKPSMAMLNRIHHTDSTEAHVEIRLPDGNIQSCHLDLLHFPPILKISDDCVRKEISSSKNPKEFAHYCRQISAAIAKTATQEQKASRAYMQVLFMYTAVSDENYETIYGWNATTLLQSIDRNQNKNPSNPTRENDMNYLQDLSIPSQRLEDWCSQKSKHSRVLLYGDTHGDKIDDDLLLIHLLSKLKQARYTAVVVEGLSEDQQKYFDGIYQHLKTLHSPKSKKQYLENKFRNGTLGWIRGTSKPIKNGILELDPKILWGTLITRHSLFEMLLAGYRILCPENINHANHILRGDTDDDRYVLDERNEKVEKIIKSYLSKNPHENLIVHYGSAHHVPNKEHPSLGDRLEKSHIPFKAIVHSFGTSKKTSPYQGSFLFEDKNYFVIRSITKK